MKIRFFSDLVATIALILLVSLSVNAAVLAPQAESSAPVLEVGEMAERLDIAVFAQLMKDPTHHLTLQNALDAKSDQWLTQAQSVLKPGYEDTAWWVRFNLSNNSNNAKDLVLDVGWPLLDYLDFYIFRQGELEASWQTGDQRPGAGKAIDARTYAFPIKIPAGETRQILFKIDLRDSTYDLIPITLSTTEGYYSERQKQNLLLGGYFGAVLALLIYNLLLFIATKEKNFYLYAGYLAVFTLFNFGFLGYGYQYLWGDAFFWNNLFGTGITIPAFFATTLFVTSFLDTKHRNPRVHKLIWALTLSGILIFVAVLLDLMQVYIPMGIVTYSHTALLVSLIAVYFSAGILSIRQGFRPARYYTLAWSFLFLGVLIYHLGQLTDFLPNNIFVRYSVLWGSAFEFLLLSLALGDRYKLMRDESQKAVQKAANVQAAYAEKLEAQVQERTLKLRSAMTQIETLARTDDLTQLLNRRAFNEILEREVSRANRQRQGVAFCILDIDDFKRYNDHYGHLAGDHVLSEIGQLIREQFRRPTDFGFRLGGEEFAILVTDIRLAQESATFFEQLRLGIESLKIAHAHSSLGVVTASFGLVMIESCDSITPKDLYREADEALYEAKSAGKNQLVVRIKKS